MCVLHFIPFAQPLDMTELKFSMTERSLFDFFPLSMLRSIISSANSVLNRGSLEPIPFYVTRCSHFMLYLRPPSFVKYM